MGNGTAQGDKLTCALKTALVNRSCKLVIFQ
jgi:hypothetical protein